MNPAPKSIRNTRDGFTLVELLVVVAIIAILASLLLASLGRGKAAARRTTCISQLRQWNLALSMYMDDHGDATPRESFIPGGTMINFWAQVRNPLAGEVWYNALPEYANVPRATTFAPLAARGDFYRKAKLFHCPAALFPKTAGSSETAFFSYAMNSKLILTPSVSVQLSLAATPSATVTFLENRLPDEPKVHPWQEQGNLGQPSAYATRFTARHLERGTLAFADGSVECRPGDDVVEDGWAIFPQRDVIWTIDPSVNPNLVN
jgi:prepilin-type N-terminal cleavage/methylation domain-containing protein/prepilin-type processing-associated H-X9-DG protein